MLKKEKKPKIEEAIKATRELHYWFARLQQRKHPNVGYSICLPKKWVEKTNWKKGDPLLLSFEENKRIIVEELFLVKK